MTAPPLTHHEILALVAPFARRGRRVDLPACDRLARRIVFRPLDHPATAGVPALVETLVLEPEDATRWLLVRTLAPADGPAARLDARGGEPADLLTAVESVAPARQIAAGSGFVLAMTHRLVPDAARPPAPVIVRGAVHVAGLELTMKVPTVGGISADLAITAAADDPIVLPNDLFAVLGRDWGHLDRTAGGWTCHLGLRGRGAARLHDAEAKLHRMAAHLAHTLTEPPARYHQRLRTERWRVAVRRTVPLAACIALIALAGTLPRFGLAQDSSLWMLIFNAPPLLLLGFFCLREMPRIELPRPPRPLAAAAWREPDRTLPSPRCPPTP